MLVNVTKNEDKLSFSLSEASSITSISVGLLRKEIKDGNLRARMVGNKFFILKSDLLVFLKDENEPEIKK